ncbi:MAG: cytochrome c [Pirellulales bacterium]|nr:cytochrome c [Pirellulales bacterium]
MCPSDAGERRRVALEGRRRRAATCCALLWLAAAAGCGGLSAPQFRLNMEDIIRETPDKDPDEFRITGREREQVRQGLLEEMRREKDPQKIEQLEANFGAALDAGTEEVLKLKRDKIKKLKILNTALVALFGTPDEPYVFPESGLDIKKIRLAAGPAQTVNSNVRRGLYRQHCVHCHGISGDGAGPTAVFLNPYPRDYRQGKFKFKSTEFAAKPTDADLLHTLTEGIPGTAMPSFKLLPLDEREALVEYVKYLSMRGEVELAMARYLFVDEEDLELSRSTLVEFLAESAESWSSAAEHVVRPQTQPAHVAATDPAEKARLLAESIERGRKLFAGEKAACVKCHGPTGLGDSEDKLYDDWNKDKDPEKFGAEAATWVLPRQQLRPRNLRLGIYRGGRRPLDLFRRIYTGIYGGPMPGAGPSPGREATLSEEEIWSVVDYIRSLPYEGQVAVPPPRQLTQRSRQSGSLP